MSNCQHQLTIIEIVKCQKCGMVWLPGGNDTSSLTNVSSDSPSTQMYFYCLPYKSTLSLGLGRVETSRDKWDRDKLDM